VLGGTPLAFAASLGAVRSAPDRALALAAVVIASIELLGLLGLVGMRLISG
jgi:hypothetical protein